MAVVLAAALNGIAVVQAYFKLFTGTRHLSTVSLRIGPHERFAVLTLATLILLGGLVPQHIIETRYHAAVELLQHREGLSDEEPAIDEGHEQHDMDEQDTDQTLDDTH